MFVHHLPPPRLSSLIKKMWVRKFTKSIAEEVKTINIATSLTRPSLSNVEHIVPKPYYRLLDQDWAERDDICIMLTICTL